MTRYAEMSRKNEALEKVRDCLLCMSMSINLNTRSYQRYTQAMHTQTLTQQSLTHVRAELTTLRSKMNRQSLALADRGGAEERLAEMETKLDEMRDRYEVERRKAKDEERRGKRLEARIAELEGQLAVKAREVDDAKSARAKDAQDLLANAKTRLEELHAEVGAVWPLTTDLALTLALGDFCNGVARRGTGVSKNSQRSSREQCAAQARCVGAFASPV